jgi:hypothetical protein
VDLLAESDFMSEEVFNKKVSKVMSPRRWLTVSDVLAAQEVDEK